MSRWTHETEHGDVLIAKDTGETVSLYASTPVTADDLEEGEAVAVFNLEPHEARDLAQWLVLYADAAEVAVADPPERAPAAAGSWWDGPPPTPEAPTADDRRKAYQVLVCTSPRNVTELGWYPSHMSVEEALKVHAAWSEWSSAVLRKGRH